MAEQTRFKPVSIEAEKSALGAMIVSEDAVEDGLRMIETAYYFSRPDHQTLYETIREMVDNDEEVDAITIAEKLETNSDLADVGGSSYLAELINSVPAPGHIKNYISILRKKYVLRTFIDRMKGLIDMAYENPDDIENLLTKTKETVQKAEGDLGFASDNGDPIIQGDEPEEFEDYFEKRKAKGFQKGILTTGFTQLDNAIMGIRRTDAVMISGEAGKGKTTTALNIMDNIAGEGGAVQMYSLEMPRKNLQHRMISKHSKVELNRLYKGGLNEAEIERLNKAVDKVRERDISIVTEEDNVRGILNSARSTLSDDGLDLMVVDYLQKLSNHLYDGAGRNEWYEDAVKKMKTFANKQKVPVIIISSLNKDGTAYYTSQSEFEVDSHLRLFDPDDGDSHDGKHESAKNRILKAQKHRHGPGGAVKLMFDGATSRIWKDNSWD